jgi:hypothetical protein
LFAGAIRTTTYANLPERYKRWDKATGVFVETINFVEIIDTSEIYTIHATVVATNMWSPQIIFGIDQTLFYAIVLFLVIIAITVIAFVALKMSRKKEMKS